MSFKRLDPEDIVISAESVTTPAWSNNVVTLQTFITSSVQVQSTQGDYYIQVWNGDPSVDTSEIQFTLGFADKTGRGSVDLDSGSASLTGISPTRINYGQYRTLILGDEESDIQMGGIAQDYFYIISIERARYKEKLLPGTFELTLTHSGSIVLIDSSPYVTTQTFSDAGREYELYKKGAGTGYTASIASTGSWGKFLPDVGLILLNGKMLDAPTPNQGGIHLGTSLAADTDAENGLRLYEAIKAGNSFKLNAEETISANYIFVRARNSEFNYSTNPSLLTGSGELRHSVMINSPQAYPTTIGFYNDSNDLLAVAKLSRPLLKDFTKEALIRTKLSF